MSTPVLKRFLSGTAPLMGRVGYLIKHPVHHTVKIDKLKLLPRFPELKLDVDDVRRPLFKPRYVEPQRLTDHFRTTLASDLMLMNYQHEQDVVLGVKLREWDGLSPYHANRAPRPPRGRSAPTKDVHPRTWKNIPHLRKICIQLFVKESLVNPIHAQAARLQLQQITNVGAKPVYTKLNVPPWKLRHGNVCGAKCELSGPEANRFLLTLTELVLPRLRHWKGLLNRLGDRNGNITFGFTPDEVRLFPEIELNLEQWNHTYGMHVTIQTTAQTDRDARVLLSGYGFPFHGKERG